VHTISSLNTKVMNYFIYNVIFEELLDAAIWLKMLKG
jgi:hypothetical protein